MVRRWVRRLGKVFLVLPLCVTVVLWVRSEIIGGSFIYHRLWKSDDNAVQHEVTLVSNSGVVFFDHVLESLPTDEKTLGMLRSDQDARWRFTHRQWAARAGNFDSWRTLSAFGDIPLRMGFAYLSFPEGFTLLIPFWFLALLAVVPPAFLCKSLIASMRRDRRRRSGTCLACGYDLSAHHAGDRCPECGNPVSSAALGDGTKPPVVSSK